MLHRSLDGLMLDPRNMQVRTFLDVRCHVHRQGIRNRSHVTLGWLGEPRVLLGMLVGLGCMGTVYLPMLIESSVMIDPHT